MSRSHFRPLVASLIFLAPLAHAQTFNGGVRGTVTDATGAALPKITVTLTDEATQQVRITTSTSDGT